jgi:apolipoprotein N-acyltransferase
MKKISNLFFCLFASALSGVLLFLAFPDYEFHWLAWVALVPFLLTIRGRKAWHAFLIGGFTGLVFFVGMATWILRSPDVTKGAGILFYIYASFYFSFFSLFLNLILRKRLPLLLTAPPLWVAFEYLRCNASFLSLPWALLGHSQYTNISLIQMTSFTGVYGVSFIIVLANAAIADLLTHWRDKRGQRLPPGPSGLNHSSYYRGLLVFTIILALWVVGWVSLHQHPYGKTLSVAVVQGNIPQEIKWKREYREQILTKYENLSEEASKSKPQLIIWPEASTPGFILSDHSLLQRMASMVRRMNTYLLAGSAEYPKFGKRQIRLKSGNTALFFSLEGKILGQYLKIRLVPFGEYVPLEHVIQWPEFIVAKGTNSNVAGTEYKIFGLRGISFGTLICWETIFPDLPRRFVKEGAEFLVNISNEAWFGKNCFPYQFLSISVFRAVENRVNLVRATNTGVSCFIDPYGRVTDRVMNGGEDIFIAGTSRKEICISPPGTFYTRHGDVFAYGCTAFAIVLSVWSLLRKKTRDRN